jgi:hypothetical protein
MVASLDRRTGRRARPAAIIEAFDGETEIGPPAAAVRFLFKRRGD